MKVMYPAVFRPETVGGYSVIFPDLKGCITEGDDLQEALEMAQEALGLYLVSLEENKYDIPAASEIKSVKTEAENIIVPVMTEVNQYRRNKAVNKTLTIPAWLNEAGERAHVNFSGILQEALKEKLGY